VTVVQKLKKEKTVTVVQKSKNKNLFLQN